MDEVTAKTKWCPHSMISALEECAMGVATYTYNRDINTKQLPAECKCLASDCAMWVWDTESIFVGDELEDVNLNTGHCGLIK